MNNPREILLARYRADVAALDAIRAGVVAGLSPGRGTSDARFPTTFVQFLVSLRWHAAAMGAMWLLAAILGRDPSEHTRGTIARGADSPPTLAYIFALREYRREIAELIDPPAAREPLPVPHACAPPRRRETDCFEIA